MFENIEKTQKLKKPIYIFFRNKSNPLNRSSQGQLIVQAKVNSQRAAAAEALIEVKKLKNSEII